MLEYGQTYTAELQADAEAKLSRMIDHYPLKDTKVEPTLYLAMTDNWIEMTLRFVVDAQERRRVKDQLHRDLLQHFQADENITVASTRATSVWPWPMWSVTYSKWPLLSTIGAPETSAWVLSKASVCRRAPWTGTVLSIDAAPGALVGSSSPVITLLDTAQLEFHTTNLSERDLAQIYPGQTAEVTLKTYPDDPIEAAVVRIGWQAGEIVCDAVTFPVLLSLSETNLDIRPGMTGRAEIRSEE
ncbi:MAG: HlyD family efflux transporter periplasmic adaptor subunit [Anaerolineales bacterium]|nr:HlyD family efflux transporter periplasmic adaptor subunit [Anaerolineales bacterium]